MFYFFSFFLRFERELSTKLLWRLTLQKKNLTHKQYANIRYTLILAAYCYKSIF